MIRTQIQIPEPLYKELKRVAKQLDWSLAEVLRRGGELLVARYPQPRTNNEWKLPGPYDLGDTLMSPEDYNGHADAAEAKLLE